MNFEERKRLSKFLSLILRHQPDAAALHLEEDGFVRLADLLTALHRKRAWQGTTEAQLREVVETSDKQRFEIVGDRIRARYGHSVPQQIPYAEIEPPEFLYHGTSPTALPAIREKGLLAMRRQYVHLSTEVEQARQVGRRHCPQPIILTIQARAAWQAGVKFYCPESRLYLADTIPPQFLDEPA